MRRSASSLVAPTEDTMTDAAPILGTPMSTPCPVPFTDDGDPHTKTRALIKGLKETQIPTPEEVASHEHTHLPSQPWCEHCIRGRGTDTRHHDLHGEILDQIVTSIEMDNFCVADGCAGSTALIAIDRSTGHLLCTAVAEKGPKCASNGTLFTRIGPPAGHSTERRQTCSGGFSRRSPVENCDGPRAPDQAHLMSLPTHKQSAVSMEVPSARCKR